MEKQGSPQRDGFIQGPGSSFQTQPDPVWLGTLSPEDFPQTMPPLPRVMYPSPHSSSQVLSVTFTVSIGLRGCPAVQRPMHFSGDPISKCPPTHIKAECQREEPGTFGQDEVYATVLCGGNIAQLPFRKSSGSGVWRAAPTSTDWFFRGESGLHCTWAAVSLVVTETPSPCVEVAMLNEYL